MAVFIPAFVSAAILYLEPSNVEYRVGDTFLIDARVDTEGECVNAVKVDLNFPKDILDAVDVASGNSILTIWLDNPKIDQKSGIISFSGGIPGGYCGPLSGEVGKPNLLVRFIFRARGIAQAGKENFGTVEFLKDSEVLLNDGLGTKAKLSLRPSAIEISDTNLGQNPKEEWESELKKDKIPPETFEIEIHHETAIFGGKYFITFFTTDKQTGVDYYRVEEGKNSQKTSSPYLLKDQSLSSIIKVRAVDKAGNERVAVYRPAKKPFPLWVSLLLTLSGMAAAYWIIKSAKRRKKNAK